MTVQLLAFINIHKSIVLQIVENDKVLAWCSLTAAQAKSAAEQITQLADMVQRDEQDAQGHRGRDPIEPAPVRHRHHKLYGGPLPGRGPNEEDAEGNEEGA